MKPFAASVAGLLLIAAAAVVPAADPPAPAAGVPASAPLRGAVQAGDTLYVSGSLDIDPKTGKPGTTPEESAHLALDAVKRNLEGAGYTMDDLVWVQIFCSDLSYYDSFNAVYRTYFHGPMPTRAFLGVDHLLRGGHFEIMGIAVKGHK
jgi:2-iminobutanoate/2-iminopropanoate deaminase